jgi:hypothetical protein
MQFVGGTLKRGEIIAQCARYRLFQRSIERFLALFHVELPICDYENAGTECQPTFGQSVPEYIASSICWSVCQDSKQWPKIGEA